MERKEAYRRHLQHFQQPGQAYFITVSLKDAVPSDAMSDYTSKLRILRAQIQQAETDRSKASQLFDLERAYYALRKKYLAAYDDLLAATDGSEVDLTQPANRQILFDAFHFYEGRRLETYAFCIMKNHFHWVVRLYEKDELGKPVYLQDINRVIKGFSSFRINERENKKGRTVWLSESFETTIRDTQHLYRAIVYTLRNPVKACLVKEWHHWAGTWCHPDYV